MRSFSHAKSYRVSFRFTPKFSDQVVVNRGKRFYTHYCRNKLHDLKLKKGKNGDLQSVVIATVVAINLWQTRFFSACSPGLVYPGPYSLFIYGVLGFFFTCSLGLVSSTFQSGWIQFTHSHTVRYRFFLFELWCARFFSACSPGLVYL